MTSEPNNCAYMVNPPRVWSRVQNTCTYDSASTQSLAETELRQQLLKGNVLQHRHNSNRLTANQRYAKIARGQWTSGKSSWATQNARGYTNPNTQMLRRNGATHILKDTMQVTALPISCPDESPIVIADGGTMICGTKHNPCTGESSTAVKSSLLFPTTASDVPGRMQMLRWNDGHRTWIPRRRVMMPVGGGQFPDNYKHLTSAVHEVPEPDDPDSPLFLSTGDPIITQISSSKYIVQFNTHGTITFYVAPTTFQYIIVGGGGAGGTGIGASYSGINSGGSGGGGGGGEIVHATYLIEHINIPYNITVGDGGNGTYYIPLDENGESSLQTNVGGQAEQPSTETPYGYGKSSSFGTIEAAGGTSGQSYWYTDGTTNLIRTNTILGGNIGGGDGALYTAYTTSKNGQNGTAIDVYGTTYTFGGGGGAGVNYGASAKTGGTGGGGTGGIGIAGNSESGEMNTGGGGGGGGIGNNTGSYTFSEESTVSTREGGSGTVVLFFEY